ncbi:MAG: ExbD/TolR family protein [Rubinisphaera brasiliensis]|uniref:ExbD/TolR family protein n=1 Tax=Rubinisphaera brasiliensis TaxID=119 RepID=UPI00391DD620|nr:biopolymer transporter ExbD [bacterium]
MRTASSPRSRTLRFAITPMIDIVFLLIIFFLVATHFVKSETLDPVNLPEATQATDPDESVPSRLVVTVSAEGKYSVNGRPFSWEELKVLIESLDAGDDPDSEREVRIRADAKATYAKVKPILLACAEAGVQKVSFSVMPAE